MKNHIISYFLCSIALFTYSEYPKADLCNDVCLQTAQTCYSSCYNNSCYSFCVSQYQRCSASCTSNTGSTQPPKGNSNNLNWLPVVTDLLLN